MIAVRTTILGRRGGGCPAGRQRAFTLVEVMVATTILSLLMLATVTALRTLGNTGTALERVTSRVDEVRTVSTFIRDLLESALISGNPGGLSLGGGSGAETFFGYGEDYLELNSAVMFGEGFGGSYRVRLGREGAQLVLRWQEIPPPGTEPDWAGTPSRVVVSGLEEFALAVREDFVSEWQADGDPLRNPVLVRLQIKASGRYWPDLIARVQGY